MNGANGHQESTTRKQPAALNLRSHSLDKLRQIMTTGALIENVAKSGISELGSV
jgi:hypothetical protein